VAGLMVKVCLHCIEIALAFIKSMSELPCDVNLYDGHLVFDAKSILAVISLDLNKVYEVQCITADQAVYEKFLELIDFYKAGR
jgi:phosphotransferase system HPr-like phosphotransfer protein